MSGLSGGSWPVLSYTSSNAPTFDELAVLWQPEIDHTNPANFNNILNNDVAAKFAAGFDVTATDYFGRAFGSQFLFGPQDGLNVTMSGIAELSKFRSYDMPMPIIHMTEVLDSDPSFAGGILAPLGNATMVRVGQSFLYDDADHLTV